MTALTPVRTKAEAALVAQFQALRQAWPHGDAWVSTREGAIAAFAANGLPHRRIEAYHYTDLRNLVREAAPLATSVDTSPAGETSLPDRQMLGTVDAYRLLVLNGRLIEASGRTKKLPRGVSLELTSDTAPGILDGEDAVVALNTAFAPQALVLKVAAGVAVEQALHVAFVQEASAPQAVFARLRVEIGEKASLTLIESHEGPDAIATQANSGVEIAVADGAKLEHVRIGAEGLAALSLSSLGLTLGKGAEALSFNLAMGSAIARHQILARFDGEGARLKLGGITMLDEARHSDVTLVVDHAVPGGQSRELFKAAIEDRANGVFQGKIIVRPHAQKTDGKMMSAALLLSEEAAMSNKPELEIFADDVQCGHGATCGELDENLLFYLMARGIARQDAKALLIRSFLGEAIEDVSHIPLREALGALVDGWLRGRGQ